MCLQFHYSLFWSWSMFQRLIANFTVERKKFIFNLLGKLDFQMLSSFRIAAQACAFLVFMSSSELSTQEPKYLKSLIFFERLFISKNRVVSWIRCVVRHVLGFILIYAVTDHFSCFNDYKKQTFCVFNAVGEKGDVVCEISIRDVCCWKFLT